jgi:hypothetical protein
MSYVKGRTEDQGEDPENLDPKDPEFDPELPEPPPTPREPTARNPVSPET